MDIEIGKRYTLINNGKQHMEKAITVQSVDINNRIVTGVTEKSKDIQSFDIDWLQEEPKELSTKYRRELIFYKATGHGRIKHIKEEYLNLYSDTDSYTRYGVLVLYLKDDKVYFVGADGIKQTASIEHFKDITNKDKRRFRLNGLIDIIDNKEINEVIGMQSKIKKRLLEFGGTVALVPDNDEIEINTKILKYGQCVSGEQSIVYGNENQDCHRNSAEIWFNDKNRYELCTGYALLNNEWVEHSWLFRKEDHTIVETTVEREAYYGIYLNTREALQFYKENI